MTLLEATVERWKSDLKELQKHLAHMQKHAVKGGDGNMWNGTEEKSLKDAIADLSTLIEKREGNNA